MFMIVVYIVIAIVSILLSIVIIKLYYSINDLKSNLSNNNLLDSQHYEYLQKLVNTAVYNFNKFDPTKVELPIGSVICFTGLKIPEHYNVCDGSKFLISEYSDLFKTIGTTFNKSTTESLLYFNIPDLQGMFVRGVDKSGQVDPDRSIGSIQKQSTSLPNNTFSTNMQGDHSHWISGAPVDDRNFSSANTNSQMYGVVSDAGTYSAQDPMYSVGRYSANAGVHQHSIVGGDKETRPINISLIYLIKIK